MSEMIRSVLIVVACACAWGAAVPTVEPEAAPAATPEPYRVREEHRERPYQLVDVSKEHPQGHARDPESEHRNRIINDVLGPVYYDREIILDYRFLRTDGRGYVKGAGGQILILPHKARHGEPVFDHLLEELRRREHEREGEREKPSYGERERPSWQEEREHRRRPEEHEWTRYEKKPEMHKKPIEMPLYPQKHWV